MEKSAVKNIVKVLVALLIVYVTLVLMGADRLTYRTLLVVLVFTVFSGLKTEENKGSVFVAKFSFVTLMFVNTWTDTLASINTYSVIDLSADNLNYTGLDLYLYAQAILFIIYMIFLTRVLFINGKKDKGDKNSSNKRIEDTSGEGIAITIDDSNMDETGNSESGFDDVNISID